MSDLLIRNLDDRAIDRLKQRARLSGRSLQKEVKLLLERVAGADSGATEEMLAGWQRKFSGRNLTPSADLIREDRDR